MSTEEVPRVPIYNVHEGIVILIELTDSLVFPDPISGKSHLEVIFEAIAESMDHSVITLPNTGYAVYLFNGDKTTKGLTTGIERLFDLQDLNYKNMKIIQDILEENGARRSTEKDDSRPYIPIEDRFKPCVGKPSVNPLDDALRLAQDDLLIKKEHQSSYSHKKIFLFTDNDHPIDEKNAQQKNILRNTRNNLEDGMISIIPFFISSQVKPFDESFYRELMTLSTEVKEEAEDLFSIGEISDTLLFDGPNPNPVDVDFIKQRILRRKEIKRKQFETSFIFSDDLVVGVKGYTLYSHEEPKRSKFLYETAEYRKNVYSRRRFIDEETGYEFEKTSKVYKFGQNKDDYFPISGENLAKLSKYDEEKDTFLRLLGFKSEKLSLKPHYQSAKSNPFLVPDENSFEGSTRTLASLYKSLIKQNKCAILFGKLRKGTQPSIYTMQPSSGDFPEGFFLIRLPFLDDIRQMPAGFEIFENPSKPLLKITELVLRKLRQPGGYDPSSFKNPTLQQHYRVLHDYLLQVEQTQEDEESAGSKLEKDDTLKWVHAVREKVEQSQLNPDGEDRLFRFIRDWNKVYKNGQI